MARVKINSICEGGGHLSVTVMLDDGSSRHAMLDMTGIFNETDDEKFERILGNFKLSCRLDAVTKETILSKSEKTVFKE